MSELNQGAVVTMTHEKWLRARASSGAADAPSLAWAVDEIDQLRKVYSLTMQMIEGERAAAGQITDDLLRIKRGEAVSEGSSALIQELEAEMLRLREFEAREAAVTNFFAAIVMFGEGKISDEQFQRVMRTHETVLCSAIEALGRRDKIRKLEGALDHFETLDAFWCFGNPRTTVKKRIDEIKAELAKMRAGE